MKIHGKKIQGPNVEIVVLPRGGGPDIVFKAAAVMDTESFDRLCPRPTPPKKLLKGNVQVEDVEDDTYKAELAAHGRKRLAWLLITSLRATEGLEWETVDYGNADTWLNYESELRDAGISTQEVNYILEKVLEANCLSQARLDEARARFLAGTAEALKP